MHEMMPFGRSELQKLKDKELYLAVFTLGHRKRSESVGIIGEVVSRRQGALTYYLFGELESIVDSQGRPLSDLQEYQETSFIFKPHIIKYLRNNGIVMYGRARQYYLSINSTDSVEHGISVSLEDIFSRKELKRVVGIPVKFKETT